MQQANKYITEQKGVYPRVNNPLRGTISYLMITGMLWAIVPVFLGAQGNFEEKRIRLKGEIVTALVLGEDTLIMYNLPAVNVVRKRIFKNVDEYIKYKRYMKYAKIVYPYAVESMRVYRKVSVETQGMGWWKKRRYINRLNKELKKQYKKPLKNLTKTQGYILVKMIERELDIPFYKLIKQTKGVWTATYYSGLGQFYGYHLKKGYIRGQDPILDIVLDDFDITKPLDEEEQCND